jgi:hypothetical protein
MLALILFLAEVGDKVPPLTTLVSWSAAITFLAVLLSFWRKWLAVVPLPLATVFAIAATAESRDRVVGPAIIHELSYGYVALAYFLAAAPFVAIALLVFRRKKDA